MWHNTYVFQTIHDNFHRLDENNPNGLLFWIRKKGYKRAKSLWIDPVVIEYEHFQCINIRVKSLIHRIFIFWPNLLSAHSTKYTKIFSFRSIICILCACGEFHDAFASVWKILRILRRKAERQQTRDAKTTSTLSFSESWKLTPPSYLADIIFLSIFRASNSSFLHRSSNGLEWNRHAPLLVHNKLRKRELDTSVIDFGCSGWQTRHIENWTDKKPNCCSGRNEIFAILMRREKKRIK